GKINVIVEANNGQKKLCVDKVLVAVGRTPVIEGLGLEQVGINFDSKGVKVNSRMETNISGIYAIGDLIGNYQLAHVASQEGIIAVDNALGADVEMKYNAIPRCIYTSPEIAAVGMTEEEAKTKYGAGLKVGRFPLSYNGKALIEGVQEGFVKVLVEPKYHQPIGCIIVGPHAPEMISQGTLALALESTVETLDEIIFPHPTISEAFKEAVLDAVKLAIHC
ncbi:MAG: FAD-dependent oxidoreductase, partial [Desulfobacterales bacterium]|nr:FAD-dependent oxidoreductase [Desulfobacterales bacterium]